MPKPKTVPKTARKEEITIRKNEFWAIVAIIVGFLFLVEPRTLPYLIGIFLIIWGILKLTKAM